MKIGVGTERPAYFKPGYPEQFDLCSHLECAAGIPQALFAITTWKGNGLPNVCFHAWSCFHGDKTAFFAVLGGLFQHTHTFANIQREKAFGINFLPLARYDDLLATIRNNEEAADECKAGRFTLETAKAIHAPLIKESFLSLECTLEGTQDLSGAGITAMVIGRVQYAWVEEAYAEGFGKRYGEDGFMLLATAPQNLLTGEPSPSGIGTVEIRRLD